MNLCSKFFINFGLCEDRDRIYSSTIFVMKTEALIMELKVLANVNSDLKKMIGHNLNSFCWCRIIRCCHIYHNANHNNTLTKDINQWFWHPQECHKSFWYRKILMILFTLSNYQLQSIIYIKTALTLHCYETDTTNKM